MSTTEQEELRLKQRTRVNLKATLSLAGKKAQEYPCMVTDLSATGARLHVPAKLSCTTGTNIDIKISIPDTIMHIPNSGEIIWIENSFNESRLGIKFKEFLSETMMDQLAHKR